MSARHFEVKTVEYGDAFRPAFAIKCGEVGCNNDDHVFNADSSVNSEKAAKKFTERGWIVGGGEKADRCPVCADRIMHRKPRPGSKKEPIMKLVTPSMGAEPEKSPAAKGAITDMYMHLGSYFDSKVGRYAEGWSDARISRETGLSESLVARRREEDFGKIVDQKFASSYVALRSAIDATVRSTELAASALASAFETARTASEDAKRAKLALIKVCEAAKIDFGVDL